MQNVFKPAREGNIWSRVSSYHVMVIVWTILYGKKLQEVIV
jgi:hypothetical protein